MTPDEIYSAGFVQIPYNVIKRINPAELQVYGILIHYSTMKNGAFPSIEKIAEEAGKTGRAVTTSLSRLEDTGLIQRIKRPGKSNIYRITKDPGVHSDQNITSEENFLWEKVEQKNSSYNPGRKLPITPEENFLYNNIEVNNNEVIENMSDSHNERNFKKWTADDFRKDVELYPEYGVYFEDFISYWTEPDHKGKMRFQLEKTWETKRRLRNWSSKDWNNKAKTEPIYQESKTEKAF